MLAQFQLAPPLLARFDNGLLYKFIQGDVCTPQDLGREPIRRGVARKLGEWHGVLSIGSISEPNGIDHMDGAHDPFDPSTKTPSFYQTIDMISPGKVTPNLWTVLQKWILALPKGTEQEQKRNAILQEELERIVIEFGNLPGLGEEGVCLAVTCRNCQALLTAFIVARLRSLRPALRECDRPSECFQ